ncbi:hypothetical protein B0H67DRAFT_500629 [Lasiosphaeris hirsuta]|uniref:HIT domain-containing protein n=1 Tax=Lasiosphaeris hirsuta TaxID=260670 RepID=A0AA39ZRI1_9PEZI|nr:hypothetical protein B0H67DRAFT_500629 [Lasiosphaeris hirsuta]
MELLRRAFHYLANLEWTERVQKTCVFCDRANFASIVYEDNDIIAIDNRRLAGQFHWLIIPKPHNVRDVEALNVNHLPLLQAMDRVKTNLLSHSCPEVPMSDVHAGYHRGRRPLFGSVHYPDIVSIHHLHLHVIVRPHLSMWLFKYPPWLPFMWKSDATVLRDLTRAKHRRS